MYPYMDPRPLQARRPARSRPAPAEAGRQSPEARRRLSAPAMRSFFNIAAAWDLSSDEQRGLLGWPATSTFYNYRSGAIGTLSFDTLTRLSLVLGIYKALHVLYPDAALADRWVKLPNANVLFSGRPALALMIDGGIDGLYQVRRLLDARRG
jgi:antitoxin Xre/MbcA/ParS-like protein